jgi:hypothetical protein
MTRRIGTNLRALAVAASVLGVLGLPQLGCTDRGSQVTVEAPKVDPKAATARPPREVTKDTRPANLK